MRPVLRSVALLLLAAPAAAAAQRAGDVRVNDRDRAGPYAFIGAGGASVSESCISCRGMSGGAISLRAGFGWAVISKVSLEASVAGTQRADDRMWERTAHLLVGVRYRVTSRVAVRLGAGTVAVRQEVPTTSSTFVLTDDGPGWMAGVSYTIPLRSDIVLDPYAEVRGSGTRDLKWTGQVVSREHTVRVLDLGVALRWHLRSLMLPKRQRPRPD
ncbi:MAG: outer membrane beta-barrel protein [Gemmatimonadetes bacterium]|nr:outer membrane beta-barrel protein [Gemmatimonadota bacterium]